MKLNLSAEVGPITVTIIEDVFWTAMILDPTESSVERRIIGERQDITGLTRDDVIKQVADRPVTLHIKAMFAVEQIKAHKWLVEPMRLALLDRDRLIVRVLESARYPVATPLHPDDRASMTKAAASCCSLYGALRDAGADPGVFTSVEAERRENASGEQA